MSLDLNQDSMGSMELDQQDSEQMISDRLKNSQQSNSFNFSTTNQSRKDERTTLKLYKPTAYLQNLKPQITKRVCTDLRISAQDTEASERRQTSYMHQRNNKPTAHFEKLKPNVTKRVSTDLRMIAQDTEGSELGQKSHLPKRLNT